MTGDGDVEGGEYKDLDSGIRWYLHKYREPRREKGESILDVLNNVHAPKWASKEDKHFAFVEERRTDTREIVVESKEAEVSHTYLSRVFCSKPEPDESCYNTLARKANESGQASKDKPYVIALDVTGAPEFLVEFQNNQNDYWQNWGHVSGVLAYTCYVEDDVLEPLYSLYYFPNPNAAYPAPEFEEAFTPK